jgi:hypothetical protein
MSRNLRLMRALRKPGVWGLEGIELPLCDSAAARFRRL